MKDSNHNLLLLTLEYPPQVGGVSTYLSDLAERYSIGTVQGLAPEIEGSHGTDMVAGPAIYRRPLEVRWLRPRWLPALYWTWLLCRRESPRMLVVSHLLNMGRVARWIRRLLGIPYTVIVHGMDVSLAMSGDRRKRVGARRILFGAALVVANSGFTAELVRSMGVPKERIEVVIPPPSLPLDLVVGAEQVEAFRQRHGLGNSFVLLSTGRLVRRKGFDICLQALAELKRSGREVRQMIVGAGPFIDELIELAQELDVVAETVFLGQVDRLELSRAFAACDAFVLVPRSLGSDVEGFGIVYLEAGIFSRPTVGSRTGGVTEAVIDGQTGLLVEPDDPTALKEAVERLIDDETLRQSLGAGGRHRVERDFGEGGQNEKFAAAVLRAMDGTITNQSP